jgi:hypothetical protein
LERYSLRGGGRMKKLIQVLIVCGLFVVMGGTASGDTKEILSEIDDAYNNKKDYDKVLELSLPLAFEGVKDGQFTHAFIYQAHKKNKKELFMWLLQVTQNHTEWADEDNKKYEGAAEKFLIQYYLGEGIWNGKEGRGLGKGGGALISAIKWLRIAKELPFVKDTKGAAEAGAKAILDQLKKGCNARFPEYIARSRERRAACIKDVMEPEKQDPKYCSGYAVSCSYNEFEKNEEREREVLAEFDNRKESYFVKLKEAKIATTIATRVKTDV